MSRGYCGYANICATVGTLVVYTYCCYDLNKDNWKDAKTVEDGEIYIDRDAFVEPEIHEKYIKKSSGRKMLVVKRLAREVLWNDLFETGRVKVKNCSNTWMNDDFGTDFMAQNILSKIFSEYQKNGIIPEHIDWLS